MSRANLIQSFVRTSPQWSTLLESKGLCADDLLKARPGENISLRAGEYLGLGFPENFHPLPNSTRLVWLPKMPKGKPVWVASSRMSKRLEDYPAWFDALRTLACRFDSKREFLVSHDGVSTHRFTRRVSDLFHIPFLELRPLLKRNRRTDAQNLNHHGYYSPPMDSRPLPTNRDSMLMQIAAKVYLLSVKGQGNTFRNTIARLERKQDTRLLADPQLTSRRNFSRLQKAGATSWHLLSEPPPKKPGLACDLNHGSVPWLSPEEIPEKEFLIHWTRRCDGKWPDLTEADFLDDLIFGSSRANHSDLASLCRILASQRLIATNQLTRHPTLVVCATEQHISRLTQLRRFRSHLSRWDGLPFGIGISKDAVPFRPVLYGNENDWSRLSESDRPLFQLGKGKETDWTLEREWRHLGDVNLENLAPDQAFVFVPSIEAANTVAKLSRWPIVVLHESKAKAGMTGSRSF